MESSHNFFKENLAKENRKIEDKQKEKEMQGSPSSLPTSENLNITIFLVKQ
jgi:hypothetical protein